MTDQRPDHVAAQWYIALAIGVASLAAVAAVIFVGGGDDKRWGLAVVTQVGAGLWLWLLERRGPPPWTSSRRKMQVFGAFVRVSLLTLVAVFIGTMLDVSGWLFAALVIAAATVGFAAHIYYSRTDDEEWSV